MMISQPAVMCLNATWQRLTGRATRGAAPAADQPLPESVPEAIPDGVDIAAESLLVTTVVGEGESPAAGARGPGSSAPRSGRCLDASGRRTSDVPAPPRCGPWP